jgi:hypothetical protein
MRNAFAECSSKTTKESLRSIKLASGAEHASAILTLQKKARFCGKSNVLGYLTTFRHLHIL